jgi:FkbH-like protein
MLKLVIWDLDQTILTGILEEGDETIDPIAQQVMNQLHERGILQALATQNPPEIIPPAIEKFGWQDLFVQVEADLGPKVRKVKRIIETLGVNPLDSVFIDEDAFERDSIAVQVQDLSSWSIAELNDYLTNTVADVTEEGRQRPQMYRQQLARVAGETEASDYEAFLRSCEIEIKVRPYIPTDAQRVEELLTRTHRMNLGILPVEEATARLNQPSEHHVIVAEMKDAYGDMGRCGVVHMTPNGKGGAVIESLTISCRTRARGLSLAMLVGMLRHPLAEFHDYYCRYIFNGFNRPLRMLLMGAGFKPRKGTDELILTTDKLASIEIPDWVSLIQAENSYYEVII